MSARLKRTWPGLVDIMVSTSTLSTQQIVVDNNNAKTPEQRLVNVPMTGRRRCCRRRHGRGRHWCELEATSVDTSRQQYMNRVCNIKPNSVIIRRPQAVKDDDKTKLYKMQRERLQANSNKFFQSQWCLSLLLVAIISLVATNQAQFTVQAHANSNSSITLMRAPADDGAQSTSGDCKHLTPCNSTRLMTIGGSLYKAQSMPMRLVIQNGNSTFNSLNKSITNERRPGQMNQVSSASTAFAQQTIANKLPVDVLITQSTQLEPYASFNDNHGELLASDSKKKKKMMKKKKKMEKKHKEWKKGKKHKKKKYESKKKKGGMMKKKKGKKEKKKWGMEKKGHKKKGNFKKKKWGHKKKMKKGHKKGKKGHKMLKDKGHKKKGFKKVYHKEEWGKKKKWHDIKREKKWNTKQKKWKKKWHQEKGKKYKGKHMKKYHKKNKHGKKYKKEKKSKWKKHKGEKFKKGHKKKKEEYSKKKEGGKKKKMKKMMKKMKKKKG